MNLGLMLLAGLVRVGVFVAGVIITIVTLNSAVRTFVLPRSASDQLAREVFLALRWFFNLLTKRRRSYLERDRIMAMYAPCSLLILLIVWLILVLIGYMAMFWAVGVRPLRAAFTTSGSSLLTLGSAPLVDLPVTLLAFSEAAIGLIMVALLIAYLPTMYSAFSKREAAVTMMEIRAGNPPSAIELLLRFKRIERLGEFRELWQSWELWFAELEESHTSLAALNFFRSPQPDRSWVVAAGVILDAASLSLAALDLEWESSAALCIRAGHIALRRIASFFKVQINANPAPDDPISITRAEFEAALDELAAGGLPLKADREQAWRDFRGWRVNYDASLLVLCRLTMAPHARWSSDRAS